MKTAKFQWTTEFNTRPVCRKKVKSEVFFIQYLTHMMWCAQWERGTHFTCWWISNVKKSCGFGYWDNNKTILKVGCKLTMSMPRLLEHRESHNSIGQSSLFMYKTIVPHYRNLDHVSNKTEYTLTLEIVYQSKSETEIDLKEKCLKQDEELKGNTGRPEKNSQIWTTWQYQ